jgi:hypothetical protein
MLVILPMHHRSPSAAGTVPTSMGGVLAELAEPALLGAVTAHPSGGHDAQLHVHGAPEAVSKVTASTAPAAAMGHVCCAAYRMFNRRVCAPLTVGVAVVGDRVGAAVVGAAAPAQSVPRRHGEKSFEPRTGRAEPPVRGGGVLCGCRYELTAPRCPPRGAHAVPVSTLEVPWKYRGVPCEYSDVLSQHEPYAGVPHTAVHCPLRPS